MGFTWLDSHIPLHHAEGRLYLPGKIMDSYSKDSQLGSFEKTQESEEKSDSRKATAMLSQGTGAPQVLQLTVPFSELSCLQVHARPNRKGVCRSVRLSYCSLDKNKIHPYAVPWMIFKLFLKRKRKLLVTPLHSKTRIKTSWFQASPPQVQVTHTPLFLLFTFLHYPSVPSLRNYAIQPFQTWPPLFPQLFTTSPSSFSCCSHSPHSSKFLQLKVSNDCNSIIIAWPGFLAQKTSEASLQLGRQEM